ncbi:hypothetical protein [Microvirga calopogonii]|uniref:hypothetical protein n=1 Tax=Microvirga calopogonii TaxID=2078013 RepID=UPI000E0D6EF9|nr:hypothetical protein [Microvirga calopogonii]
MAAQDDLVSHALHAPGLLEELEFLEHRIQFGPTQAGWVSFVARQGHRPTILLAPDRATLLKESQRLIERRLRGGAEVMDDRRSPLASGTLVSSTALRPPQPRHHGPDGHPTSIRL